MTNNENNIITEDGITPRSVIGNYSCVTFDLDGGTGTFPDVEKLEGETMVLSAIPQKRQYEFEYWQSLSGAKYYQGDTYTFGSAPDTLTAVWSAIFCVVSFDLDGGTGTFPDISLYIEDVITFDTAPVKDCYTFVKWESSRGEEFYIGDSYTLVHSQETFTAIWEPMTCQATFDYNGGTGDCYGIALLIGDSFEFDFTPVKEHFTFVKWVSTRGEEYYIGDEYTFVYPDETFTAVWTPTLYTLTYDLNGGDNPEIYPSQQGYYGDSTTIPTTTPEKAGYNFMQWDSLDGTSYFPGDTYNFTCNDTLSAGWIEKTYCTVTFDLDGGNGNFPDITHESGEPYNLSTVPVKEGYTFIKWVDSMGQEYYVNDDYYFFSVDDTLTAIWGCTVTFDLDGGMGLFEPITKIFGESLNVCETVPVKEGAIFVSWSNSDGQIFDANTPYTFTYGNDTLTAVWQEANVYMVSFDLAGGTGNIPILAAVVGDSITISNRIPIKEGYTFERWEDSDGTPYLQGSTYNNGVSTTLTAVWSATVQLDYNGGEGDATVRKGLEGDSFSLYTPTREGYSFVKWVNSVGAEYGLYYFNYGADTLKAIWKCTLSFNTDGGEALESITKAEGESVTLVAPHKEGFTFVKWVNSSNTEFFEGDEYFFTNGNDTLTAIWGYTLSYDLNGGTGDFASQIKDPDSELIIHAGVPEKEGYTFVNWESSDGNKHYVSGEAYTSDANETLTAVWAINGETVITYDLNGGTGDLPKQTKASDQSVALYTETPTKEGMVFYGWVDRNGNVYSAGDIYQGAEHLTLTADFRHVYQITYQDFYGNVCKTQAKIEGETVNLLDYEPQSDEYKFVCWKSDEFEGNLYPRDEFSLDMDVTLIPVGKRIYVLVYWSEGEFFDMKEKYEGEDTHIIEDTPIREGYKFVCWKTRDGKEKYYLPGHLYTKDEDIGFDAQWVQEDNISVTYSVGDADGNFPMQELSPGDSVTIHSNVPTKEGYVFECWVEEDAEEDETEAQNESQTYSVTRGVTILSKYYPGDAFRLYTSKKLFPLWVKRGITTTNVEENTAIMLSDMSCQLEWILRPKDLDFIVLCTSSNPSVASISNNGLILVHSPGETTITLKAIVKTTGELYTTEFQLFVPDRELENIFSDFDNVMPNDPVVKYKALNKMELYYKNNSDIQESIDKGETCIFAFEGLGSGYGEVSTLHPLGFLNAMMVVTKGKEIVYVTRRASTLPDWRPKTVALRKSTTLKEGIYTYYVDNHKEQYIALLPYPRGIGLSCWYKSDDKEDKFKPDLGYGINIHATHDHQASIEHPFSAGCQTVYYEDYVDFGEAVGFLDKYKTYKSTLDVGDSLGAYMADLVKTTANNTTIVFPDKITYILDRSYDVNNGPTSTYPHGVFYPINSDGIEE
ncbi:MAG: InlB B-repeat-containing protein [Clostridia bacterium]|nr:InlB B-repeat-containing protein [Clostridia bacterium]